MKKTHSVSDGAADSTRRGPEEAASHAVETHRKVPCRRCREPLFFPTGYSAQHRAPVMFCRKCGAQTQLPIKHRWLFALIAVIVFIAAWIMVIQIWLKEDALAP